MKDFDVTFPERPLHSRRDIMVKGLAGALVLGGYGSSGGIVLANEPGVAHGESPGLTEGPYWVDGQPVRSNVLTDSTTGAVIGGIPCYLGLTISQLSDSAPYTIKPLVGARIDTWCASAQGVYSDISSEGTASVNYLRGAQVTNSQGIVNFVTIVPGWYSGRTPHIHIRIRTFSSTGATTYNFTSQLFFPDSFTTNLFAANSAYSRSTTRDTYNTTDTIYGGSSYNGSPSTEAGDYLVVKPNNNGTRVTASFHFVIDLSDSANADPTNGAQAGSGPGGGGTPPTGGPGGGGTPPTGGPGGGGTPPSE